jgi:hypothetical protein
MRLDRLLPFVALLAACSSSTPEAAKSPPPTTSAPDAGDPGDASGDAPLPPDVDAIAPDAVSGGEEGGSGSEDGGDAGNDAGATACAWGGAPGECIAVATCAALGGHSSYAGLCPGPAMIECCITTPNPEANPPIPPGYKLMAQAQVTSAMTTWAVAILNDPVTYPMFSTAMMTFGAQPVLARVEWHPPDFQNSVVHRGVTLYVPG